MQYREIQGSESRRFLTYFPRFMVLRGGVDTGFHHVSEPPPLDTFKLYQISNLPLSEHSAKSPTVIREVPPHSSSLTKGDVFVLDIGERVLQLNTVASSGKEKFLAGDFARSIVDSRSGRCELIVCGKHAVHDY